MGVDVGASIVVGRELKDFDVPDDVDFPSEYFEELGLESLSPYFDAGPDDCIHGIKLINVDYTYAEIPSDLMEQVRKSKEKFLEITGMEGTLYFGPDVW